MSAEADPNLTFEALRPYHPEAVHDDSTRPERPAVVNHPLTMKNAASRLVQIELPLDPFETLGKRLLQRTEGMCVLSLDMTLVDYHNQWNALVAMMDEVCVLARSQIKRLEACLRREQGKERRRIKEEIEKLRALLKDAYAVIESRFMEATEPILAASEKYHENDDEWYSNTISDVRACEVIGHLTLRQIIEEYA